MIPLRPRDQHVWDPRPLPHETEAETKTKYCDTETETETKEVVSRPLWSRDLNILPSRWIGSESAVIRIRRSNGVWHQKVVIMKSRTCWYLGDLCDDRCGQRWQWTRSDTDQWWSLEYRQTLDRRAVARCPLRSHRVTLQYSRHVRIRTTNLVKLSLMNFCKFMNIFSTTKLRYN